MASVPTVPREIALRRTGLSWSSIFGGTFMFLAIEVTFGILGVAVFASAANPHSAHPVGGMSTGIGIWTIVLSIIALYFAGKTAGRLSNAADRNSGMYHGLVTFGMSIFTTVLVAALALGSTVAGNANPGAYSSGYIANVVSTSGWWLFFALLLSMIAAAVGGSHGVDTRSLRTEERTPELRRVA